MQSCLLLNTNSLPDKFNFKPSLWARITNEFSELIIMCPAHCKEVFLWHTNESASNISLMRSLPSHPFIASLRKGQSLHGFLTCGNFNYIPSFNHLTRKLTRRQLAHHSYPALLWRVLFRRYVSNVMQILMYTLCKVCCMVGIRKIQKLNQSRGLK